MSLIGGIPLIPDQVLGTNRSMTSWERNRSISSGCERRKSEEHCVVIKSLYSCRWNSYVFLKRSSWGPWLVGNGNSFSSSNSNLSIPFQMSLEVPKAMDGEPMGPADKTARDNCEVCCGCVWNIQYVYLVVSGLLWRKYLFCGINIRYVVWRQFDILMRNISKS